MINSLIGDTYAYVNTPRDNATYESTPIWYNKEKYELIESGSQWISETPNEMSKIPESEYYRIYTYVVLENKETGARFAHVNTHLDLSEAARKRQVSILISLTSRLSGMPLFYTADWNFYENSEPYKEMEGAGFIDASKLAPDTMSGNTLINGGEIDFCFTSVVSTSAVKYAVVNDHEYSQSASDHYPILIDLKIIR